MRASLRAGPAAAGPLYIAGRPLLLPQGAVRFARAPGALQRWRLVTGRLPIRAGGGGEAAGDEHSECHLEGPGVPSPGPARPTDLVVPPLAPAFSPVCPLHFACPVAASAQAAWVPPEAAPAAPAPLLASQGLPGTCCFAGTVRTAWA